MRIKKDSSSEVTASEENGSSDAAMDKGSLTPDVTAMPISEAIDITV